MSIFPSAIDRYKIVKLLGSGAMGNVYLAEDPTLGRMVALKVITIGNAVHPQVRDAYLSRFSAEAKALARLDHPCIVQIYDSGEERGKPWIAFQFVDGESLEAILSRRRNLTLRRALLFAIDIASALQHAHEWNIIHRDVKPGNILIDQKTGVAKLTDFGIAQAPWSKFVENGSMVGSPGYMSPEQIDGKEVDRRSDIFSLGSVLYRMLTGETPFLRATLPATIDATCRGDYLPLRDLVPDAPKALDAAIRRCLFANYKMRIASAAELIEILTPLIPEEKVGKALPQASGMLQNMRFYDAFSMHMKKVIVQAQAWKKISGQALKAAVAHRHF
jgi:eukaryotic-like serine/threonine-protein kinase